MPPGVYEINHFTISVSSPNIHNDASDTLKGRSINTYTKLCVYIYTYTKCFYVCIYITLCIHIAMYTYVYICSCISQVLECVPSRESSCCEIKPRLSQKAYPKSQGRPSLAQPLVEAASLKGLHRPDAGRGLLHGSLPSFGCHVCIYSYTCTCLFTYIYMHTHEEVRSRGVGCWSPDWRFVARFMTADSLGWRYPSFNLTHDQT